MRLCKMARLRAFCAFGAFLCVFSCQNGLQKSTNVCRIVQKTLLCNTPFSYTPFCVSSSERGLDGPAIRNANRGDSHESIRAN